MGDMADICFDMAMEEEIEYIEIVRTYSAFPDEKLKELSKNSRLPIIKSIRRYEKLSIKQRQVLINYLAEKEMNSEC